jgi:anaphase-promoting complex subunit 1
MMVDNEQPVDELLNELNMGALGIGMGGLGIYDGEGLRNEVLMTKLDSYSFRCQADSEGGNGGRTLPKVFTLHASSASMAAAAVGKENGGRKVVLCIMNAEEGLLMLVTFTLQIYPSMPK